MIWFIKSNEGCIVGDGDMLIKEEKVGMRE
jgi:hypothetical protein